MAETEAPISRKTRPELLKETTLNAEADAIRHAEDLLEREFPIVGTVERNTQSSLAELRSDYTERQGELEAEGRVLEQNLETAQGRLHQAETALRRAGVPEEELGLPPAPRRRIGLPQAAAAVGAAAAAALFLSQVISTSLSVVLLTLIAIGLVAWLTLDPTDEGEPEEMRRLREHRMELDRTTQKLQDEATRNTAAVEQLERDVYARAMSEIAFAGELAATYASAAFSALPAGTLEGGREFAPQREPRVELPDWLRALAPEDEE